MKNKTILITGGANGIGYHLARYFSFQRNHNVIITDINEIALTRAKRDIQDEVNNDYMAHDITLYTRKCDVSQNIEVFFLKNWIEEKNLGPVDIIINNAGIGDHGELADTDLSTLHNLMRVNFWGPINHIQRFLPDMIKNGEGQIINVCSGQVFFKLPTWGAYTCTKAALAAYSEILHYELKKHNVHVTTVYPFMVNTGFYDDVKAHTWGSRLSMRLLPYYSMKPEKVAQIIYKAILKKKQREMVSVLNHVGQLISVLSPVSNLVGKISTYLLAK